MRFYNAFHDTKPDTGAGFIVHRLIERPEDFLLVFFADTYSVVSHFNHKGMLFRLYHAREDALILSIFTCIRQQIAYQFGDRLTVHHSRKISIGIFHFQMSAMLGDERFETLTNRLQ